MMEINNISPARTNFTQATKVAYEDSVVRKLIYLYIFFLLFEGALRKWLLPGLSTPLILVRDPIAALIIFQYAVSGRRIFNPYTLTILVVGILSFLFSMVSGHRNILVGMYGLRTLVLHFFLVFIIGEVLNRSDVERIGRQLLLLVVPVTLLVALQFYSPQTAWVNRGVGGDMSGSGFGGALDYFRPSGLFSFTNGNTMFYGLVAAVAAYFWSNRQRCSNILLFVATACLIITVPLSISRTYVFYLVLTVIFLLVASLRSGRSFVSLLAPIAVLPVIFLILSQFEFMQTAMEVLANRFEGAGRVEGGVSGSIESRIFGSMADALSGGEDGKSIPFWGKGLGLGTNVGAILMSGSGEKFLVSEAEWLRVVGEMGPFLGLVVLGVRSALSVNLGIHAFTFLRRGNTLPFLLFSFALPTVLIGGWAQPTSLGFFVLIAGFTIAGSRESR